MQLTSLLYLTVVVLCIVYCNKYLKQVQCQWASNQRLQKYIMVFYFTNVGFDILRSATNTFNSACKVSTLSRVVRTISLVYRLKVGKIWKNTSCSIDA